MSFYNFASQSHTDVSGPAMQGTGLSNGSNLGFSVLPKDTLANVQEELGIELPKLGLKDDTLYLLNHNRNEPKFNQSEFYFYFSY